MPRWMSVLTSGSHLFLRRPHRCRECGKLTLWGDPELGVPVHPGTCTELARGAFEREASWDDGDDAAEWSAPSEDHT